MRFWRPIMCSRSPTDRAGNVITRPWLAACLVYSQHATIAKRRRALSRLRLAGLCNTAASHANCACAMHFARHKPKSRFRLRAVHFPLLCRTSFYIILLGLTRDLWLLGRQRDGLLCAALAAGGRGRCWLLDLLLLLLAAGGLALDSTSEQTFLLETRLLLGRRQLARRTGCCRTRRVGWRSRSSEEGTRRCRCCERRGNCRR